jgi:hypothetical protein
MAVRGADVQQLGMFSYVSVDESVPADHPIRKLRVLVDAILKELDEHECAKRGILSTLAEVVQHAQHRGAAPLVGAK